MRQHRLIAALFPLLVLAPAAHAQHLPQYVAGPYSGYVYDCQQAKQTPPAARHMVLSADLDGDGVADHLIDAGRGCAANKLLYCGPDGCRVSLYLSSKAHFSGSYRARRVRVSPGRLELVIDGPACGKPAGADCTEIRVWNGTELARQSVE